METGLEGLSLQCSTCWYECRAGPMVPHLPPTPRDLAPHPLRPGAWAGTLPSRNVFPAAASVARGNRRPARGPARRQLQGTAPGSQALPPPPSPRCHLRPRPAPCAPARLAPEPRPAARPRGPPQGPGRSQWQGGVSRSPRPLVPRPLEGAFGSRMRLTGRQPAEDACVAACCVHVSAVGPAGPHRREAAAPASSQAGGASGCTHRARVLAEENEETAPDSPTLGLNANQ